MRHEADVQNESSRLAAAMPAAPYIPASVCRLQFNKDFDFKKAIAVLPHLKRLGIDAVYASPYFQANPSSMHGYDIADSHKINPELGGEPGYEAFCRALREHGLGQILDVVPNHMGIGGNLNRWWMDVLENGPASLHARFFDIDWEPEKKELRNKVLIPILGDLYGKCLENQELKLEFKYGQFFVVYWDKKLPVSPTTYPSILGYLLEDLEARTGERNSDYLEYLSIITAFRNLPPTDERDPEKISERHREKEIAKRRLGELSVKSPAVIQFIESRVKIFNGKKGDFRSFDLLDALLAAQCYRVAHWRVASEEINYRRFFNINELAAIRIEDEEVFREHHKRIFELVAGGAVQGLRIDHPDGLYDPPEYFDRLQRAYLECRSRESGNPDGFDPRFRGDDGGLQLYVVVEKILDREETLPLDWKVHGTVGYDFLNQLNGLYIKRENEGPISRIYSDFTGLAIDFPDLLYRAKKFFALVEMAGEINMLGSRLDRISEKSRLYRDLTRNNLTLAIREAIGTFPVYRTYISPRDARPSARDEKYIRAAIQKARKRTPALNPVVFDFLQNILLMNFRDEIGLAKEEEGLYRDFIMRFQQLTGPVMAKGMEDTAFYIDNRFISLNEVGGDPTHFGVTQSDFHRANAARNRRWPAGFTSVSTHDTKRSHDVRMRLNVLSEIPDEWAKRVFEWGKINESGKAQMEEKSQPSRNVEYFIYQSLAGVWPNEPMNGAELGAFADRMWKFVLKSLREAKLETSWDAPYKEYEDAVEQWFRQILRAGENPFLKSFTGFHQKIAYLGMLNSLSSLVLQIGAPGVADLYQSSGIWDYTLVDPDNRGQVDFGLRERLFEGLEGADLGELAAHWKDGRIKLFLLAKALGLRREHKDLFVGAEYLPLETEGKRKENATAFMRKSGSKIAIAASGRFFSELGVSEAAPLNSKVWEDTAVILPAQMQKAVLRNIFTGQKIHVQEKAGQGILPAAQIFSELGACILTNE